MNGYVTVDLTSATQLLQYGTSRLRSSKGDYLHRPDGPPGVTTWPAGEIDWGVEQAESGRLRLKSWKGDYLHHPDGPPGVTTWPVGEIEWTVEVVGDAIRLKSWRDDYLCRLDAPSGVTTATTGALDWSVERPWSTAETARWKDWLAMLLKDKGIATAAIHGRENGSCWAASSGLDITAPVARTLAAGLHDPAPLQATGAILAGQKFMFLTVNAGPAPTLVLRKGPVTALVTNSLRSTIIVLTVPGGFPANVTQNLNVAQLLIKQGS